MRSVGEVKVNGVRSVVEFGMDDGAQFLLARYPSYAGYDVARTLVLRQQKRYQKERTDPRYTQQKRSEKRG